MKKFLLITESFPPSSMGYAQRVGKLCKYIVKVSDWVPTVISAEYRPETGYDPDLIQEIPSIVEVYRIPYDKITPKSYIYKFRKLLMFPDDKITWAKKVVRFVKKEFSLNHSFKFVVSSGPPRSSYLAGLWISKLLKIPLVLDMRDPWLAGYIGREYSYFHLLINRFWERKIYKSSSYIIANTLKNKITLLKHNRGLLSNDKIIVIPNGVDYDDILSGEGPKLRDNYKSKKKLRYIHFLYLGGIRGRIPRIGVFEKPMVDFFSSLIKSNPVYKELIRIHIVGSDGRLIKDYIFKHDLNENFVFHGQVPSKSVSRPLLDADICIIILNKETRGSGWVPSKLYYYLSLDKPILAFSPENETTRLIKEYSTNYLIIYPGCETDGNNHQRFLSFLKGIRYMETHEERIRKMEIFDRRAIAKRFSDLFDRIYYENSEQ